MKIVATNHRTYNHKMNYTGLEFQKYRVEMRYDLNKIRSHILFKLRGKINYYWYNSFRDFDLGNADIYHLFNGISFGKKPWVSTYEWTLPVWGSRAETNYRQAARLLAGDPCKKIIAMSKWATLCQTRNAQEYYGEFSEEILAKSCIVSPSQVSNLASIEDRAAPGDLVTFSMIGHDFFRKGGGEVLRVFDRMLDRGAPVALNIISRMQYGDPPSASTREDHESAMRIIAKHGSRIRHHGALDHASVIGILKATDVGLLPTYHDTYGYSVLEAQSCGCPVITTDIYALPEINNDAAGWVIGVSKNEELGVDSANAAKRREVSGQIEHGLESVIGGILEDRSVIRRKGALALERIAKEHDPVANAAKLERIYDEATARG